MVSLEITQKKSVLTKQQEKQIEEFKQMTQSTHTQAKQYLVNGKWNFQNAVNSFYDDGEGAMQPEQQKNNPEIEGLFKKFAVENKQKVLVMDEDGFANLVSDYLNIDLENPVIGHILTNCMKVPKAGMGKISQENLENLFNHCGARSLKQLAAYVPKLEKELEDPEVFKSMYMKLYDLYLIENFTTIDFDLAEQLWAAYLKPQMAFWKDFEVYLNKMGGKKPPKVHKDLWRMLYEFATTIKKVNDYKEEDGWPVLIDEFIDHLRDRKK